MRQAYDLGACYFPAEIKALRADIPDDAAFIAAVNARVAKEQPKLPTFLDKHKPEKPNVSGGVIVPEEAVEPPGGLAREPDVGETPTINSSPPLAPEPPEPLATAEAFIAVLTGSADTVIRLRFFHDSDKSNKASYEIGGTIRDLWPQIEQYQREGFGCFYIVNETILPVGNQFANDGNVTAIRALFTDHDTGLPEKYHLSPTMLVKTSAKNGVQKGQALWTITAGMDVKYFKPAQRQLAAHYQSDKAVCNLSRVLRLPGSYHLKDPSNPQLVTFEDYSMLFADKRSAADILTALAAQPAQKTPRHSSGQPIAEKVLREAAAFVDPFDGRSEWLPLVISLRTANIVDDDGSLVDRVVQDWCAGDLDTAERFKDVNHVYSGSDAVDEVLDTTKVEGDISLGTFLDAAAKGGWKGDPYSTGEPASKTFENFAGKVDQQQEQQQQEPPKRTRRRLQTVAQLYAGIDLQPLIRKFIHQQENVAFFGRRKLGKSFIALEVALCVASGQKVFGTLDIWTPGPVVYLTGEGALTFKKRIQVWGLMHGLTEAEMTALPFYFMADVPQTQAGIEGAQAYINEIKQTIGSNPVLAVIDTMANSLGTLDEQTTATPQQYLDLTNTLREGLDCTLLTVAHAGKTEGKGIRGASGFEANFDGFWEIEGDDKKKIFKMNNLSKDEGDLGPYCGHLDRVELPTKDVYGDHFSSCIIRPLTVEEFDKHLAAVVGPVDPEAINPDFIRAFLREHGHHDHFINGITTYDLAGRIVAARYPEGQPPRVRDEAGHSKFMSDVKELEKHLDNGCRKANTYKDGRTRKAGHYLSLTEMVVPAGATAQTASVRKWACAPLDNVVDLDSHRHAGEV